MAKNKAPIHLHEILNATLPLEALDPRFENLGDRMMVKINYRDYIPFMKKNGPAHCKVSFKNIITLLENDISVTFDNIQDILKFRNSLIYYNEYFCQLAENKDSKPAYHSFDLIDEMYQIHFHKPATKPKLSKIFNSLYFMFIRNAVNTPTTETTEQRVINKLTLGNRTVSKNNEQVNDIHQPQYLRNFKNTFNSPDDVMGCIDQSLVNYDDIEYYD